MSDTVIVHIIEKTYWYDHSKDRVCLNSTHIEDIETSPREALDLICEVNSKMTEDETLLELKSGNCRLVTTYATIKEIVLCPGEAYCGIN